MPLEKGINPSLLPTYVLNKEQTGFSSIGWRRTTIQNQPEETWALSGYLTLDTPVTSMATVHVVALQT